MTNRYGHLAANPEYYLLEKKNCKKQNKNRTLPSLEKNKNASKMHDKMHSNMHAKMHAKP